jgi:hypothetical protein
MKCTVEQRIFIYGTFWSKCRRKFQRKLTESVVRSKAIIYGTVAKFRATGSVLDKMKTRKRHVTT